MVIRIRWHSPAAFRAAEWVPGDAESIADVTELLGEPPDVCEDGTFTFRGEDREITVYPHWWVYRGEAGPGVVSEAVARGWLTESPRLAG